MDRVLESKFIKELFFKSEKEFEDFRDKIVDFIEILEKEDNFIDNSYMPLSEFNSIPNTPNKYPKKVKIIAKEANQRIDFNWKISCFKNLQLTKGIVYNFNQNNYYLALILLRNLSEVVALLYYNYLEIKLIVEEINKNTKNQTKYDTLVTNLENINLRFSQGSSLKEHIEGKPDMKVKNILNAIDCITKNKYSNFRMHYEGLSQIAHPNGMSNRIFGIINDFSEENIKKEIQIENNKININKVETEYYFRDFEDIDDELKILSPLIGLRHTIYYMFTHNIDIFLETINNMKEIRINKLKVGY